MPFSPAKNSTESFDSHLLSTSKWANWGGVQCVIVDGQLKVSTTLTATYYGMDGKDYVDMTGSEVIIELVNAGNQALVSFEAYPIEVLYDTNNIVMFLVTGNTLYAYKKVAGVGSSIASVAYNAVNHRWLRIRESAGTTYWDTSPNRQVWTNLTSAVNPIVMTNIIWDIVAGCYAIEGSISTLILDNLNFISKEKVHNIGRSVKVANGMSVSGSNHS